MNPYERTAEEMKKQSEGPKRFAKTAIGVGSALGAASFAPMLARAAPFLSQYIPQDLAIKGLSKISPHLGSFVKNAMDSGYDFSQLKDFIGDQINQSQKQPEGKNIIQKYSPELHQFVEGEIKKGRSPIEAGALAEMSGKFKKEIKQLIKDHKAPWSSIIESVFGGGERQNPSQPQQQRQQGQSQQPQQAQGGLDPQLAQILQGMQQTMSRIRGG